MLISLWSSESIFSVRTGTTACGPASGMLHASFSMIVRYSFAVSSELLFSAANAEQLSGDSSNKGIAKKFFSARSRI
jgi:hypothetical protein